MLAIGSYKSLWTENKAALKIVSKKFAESKPMNKIIKLTLILSIATNYTLNFCLVRPSKAA